MIGLRANGRKRAGGQKVISLPITPGTLSVRVMRSGLVMVE